MAGDGEDTNQLPTESDSFRGTKDLEKQAKDLVSILLRNRTSRGEWSKATFEGASKDGGSGAFLSEQVKPGHEEGFYLKKAKGKLHGCLRMHLTRPPASLSLMLGPEDQCAEVQLLEEPSERSVLHIGVDGNSQGRMLTNRGTVRNRVFSVQVGFVDGSAMGMSDETILLEIVDLGAPPNLLGYKIPRLQCGMFFQTAPMIGKPEADPAVKCWEFTGFLPDGLSLCSETGVLKGVPKEAGRFVANITAVHVAGSSSSCVNILVELDDEAKEVVLRDAIASVEFHAHCELRLPAANASIDVCFNTAFKDAAEKIRNEPGIGNSASPFVKRLLYAMAVSATNARQLSRAIASRAEREVVVPFEFLSIQDALDSIGPDGGTVTVLEGTYCGDLRVEKHVLLQGKDGTPRPVLEGHIKVISGGEYAAFKNLVLRTGAGKVTEPVLSITCGHPIVEGCEMSSHVHPLVRVQRLEGPGTSLALWGNVIHYPPLKSHKSSSIVVDDGCRVDAKRNVFFDATQSVQLSHKASMISRGNALAAVDPFEKRNMAYLARQRQKRQDPELRVEPFAAQNQVSLQSTTLLNRSFNKRELNEKLKRPHSAPTGTSSVTKKVQTNEKDFNESIYASSRTASYKQLSRWAEEDLKAQGDIGCWAANLCVRPLFNVPGWRDQRSKRGKRPKSILKPPERSSFHDLSMLSISSSCPAMRPATR